MQLPDEDVVRVWISKYALTGGITEHEARIKDGAAYPGAPFAEFVGFTLGTDAHDTLEGAVAAANAAREKKIASLKRQIAKLEKLKFSVADGARKLDGPLS